MKILKTKDFYAMKKFRKSFEYEHSRKYSVDIDCLHASLAYIIADSLRNFLKAEKGPNGGFPCEAKSYNEWLQILRTMIFAFDELSRSAYGSSYEELDNATKSKIESGLQFFIKYFRYLWI